MAKSSQKKIDYNKHYNKENRYANQKKYHKSHPSKTYGLRVFSHEVDIMEQLENKKNKITLENALPLMEDVASNTNN